MIKERDVDLLEADWKASSGAGGCASPYVNKQGVYGDREYSPFNNAYT